MIQLVWYDYCASLSNGNLTLSCQVRICVSALFLAGLVDVDCSSGSPALEELCSSIGQGHDVHKGPFCEIHGLMLGVAAAHSPGVGKL